MFHQVTMVAPWCRMPQPTQRMLVYFKSCSSHLSQISSRVSGLRWVGKLRVSSSLWVVKKRKKLQIVKITVAMKMQRKDLLCKGSRLINARTDLLARYQSKLVQFWPKNKSLLPPLPPLTHLTCQPRASWVKGVACQAIRTSQWQLQIFQRSNSGLILILILVASRHLCVCQTNIPSFLVFNHHQSGRSSHQGSWLLSASQVVPQWTSTSTTTLTCPSSIRAPRSAVWSPRTSSSPTSTMMWWLTTRWSTAPTESWREKLKNQ